MTALASRLLLVLERIPYSFLALVARIATFAVFWRAGTVKLDDWPGTISLFADEYRVPLLPPEWAAIMATSVELGAAVLVLTGLGTRIAAIALLGLVGVIQFFVYPQAWPEHVQWTAFLLLLVARGAGSLSLDALVVRFTRGSRGSAA